MSNALVVPDPRKAPVPPGWAETQALPVILGTNDWDALDEYEAQLRAVASFIASFEGDAIEFEKALRIVDCQRGNLLGPDPHPGKPASRVTQVDDSIATQQRWRRIAREWEDLWPTIRDAKVRREVTQAAVLRMIAGEPVVHVNSVAMPEPVSGVPIEFVLGPGDVDALMALRDWMRMSHEASADERLSPARDVLSRMYDWRKQYAGIVP
jgi:hypothetical protein